MLRLEWDETFSALVDHCFKKWGAPAQIIMLFEEFAEATQAVSHSWRNLKTVDINHVIDELADAFIMIAEFVDRTCGSEEFNNQVQLKLKRLMKMLTK